MKITENLKKKLQKAKADGYKNVIITKGGMFGNTAIATVSIDKLLSLPTGSTYNSGARGYWLTAKDKPYDDGIGYADLFRRY